MKIIKYRLLRWCLEGFFFNILSTFSAFPFQFVGIHCDGPEFNVLLSLRRNANLRDTLWHGIPLNFVCARVAYGWMSCGCVLQKNMLQKKSVPVQSANCWIILSRCILFFWKIYAISCLPGLLRNGSQNSDENQHKN